jgi:hypothetical protein
VRHGSLAAAWLKLSRSEIQNNAGGVAIQRRVSQLGVNACRYGVTAFGAGRHTRGKIAAIRIEGAAMKSIRAVGLSAILAFSLAPALADDITDAIEQARRAYQGGDSPTPSNRSTSPRS